MISLATCVDGRQLYYDATLYEFRLDRSLVNYRDVLELDNHAHLAWNAPEQRDWFRKINPVDLDRCNRSALGRHGNGFEQLSPEEQVLADAKRDDSVLAGKIVEADPALVNAVVEALQAKGVFANAAVPGGRMPQPVIAMPQGMEALSQLQKQEGRKMTATEHYLMRKILKNDDKEKLKRERYAAKLEAEDARENQREESALQRKAAISKAQKRVARKDRRREKDMREYSDQALRDYAGYTARGRNTEDMSVEEAFDRADQGAWDRIEEIEQGAAVNMTTRSAYRRQDTVYYDSFGNPIRPEDDAVRPDASQSTYHLSAEARALMEMRQRNLAEQAASQPDFYDAYVPGMEQLDGGKRKKRRNRNEGASVNGHEVNADGTYKDTRFSKAMKGLGQFNEAISPLVGGGGGGMGGPGGGGGAGMGSGGGMGGGMGGGAMGSGMGGGR